MAHGFHLLMPIWKRHSVGNDYPTAVGEGNYREFSVGTIYLGYQRRLTAGDTLWLLLTMLKNRFVEIWAALHEVESRLHGFQLCLS